MGGRLVWQRGVVTIAVCLVSWLFALTLRAEPSSTPSEAFRIIWSSSTGCAESTRFLSELDRRTTRLRPARPGEHAITLIIELFATASGGVRGQLTVRKPAGDLTVRDVPGPNCQEVESALALIVALMVDPLASSSEHVGSGAHWSEPPVSPAQQRAAEPQSSLRVEQRATVRTAIAPTLAWGQALGLMLTREGRGWRPSLGLTGNFARGTTSRAAGSAEFEWTALQLAICPVGWQPNPVWDLRACATVQAGRLRAAGFATINPAEQSSFWSAAGALLEARVQLIEPLWLGASGGLDLPFSRERFYLEPSQTLHQVPALGVSFGLGVGLRFF